MQRGRFFEFSDSLKDKGFLMAIKKSELYSSLWQSCDELRGGNRRITAALLP